MRNVNYKAFELGEVSMTKENFEFVFKNQVFIRHSEYAIRKLVKDMGIKSIYITRDKGHWVTRQRITQEWIYNPK